MHQKGIIHRDIKPSNILVADHDGVPVPKVIDFGIAKATAGQTLTNKTLFTAFEQFIGTPAYMSPEQAKLSGLDIDTRSDIYSLGVLLYELLTGRTPFDAKRLVQAGLDEIQRIIREEDPPRPSTRLSTLEAAEQTTVARQRQTDPPKLAGLVRGDLDWIVMKMLEKDRSRRYETANDVAMDLKRFLGSEPVLARPPSSLYRLQKLVRRNTLAFGAAGAVLAALVLGLGLSTWLYFRERAERLRAVNAEQAQIQLRQQAQTEATKSQQVAQFLKDMLKGVGPSVAKGRDTTMLKEILEKTVQRVGTDLKNQPEVETELDDTIGDVYVALSDSVKAKQMYNRELRAARRVFGNEHPKVAEALISLAGAVWLDGDLSEVERLARQALAIQEKFPAADHTNVAVALVAVGGALTEEGKFAEAEPFLRRALAIYTNVPAKQDLEVALALNNMAHLVWNERMPAEAEVFQRRAHELYKKELGEESLELANSFNNLGAMLHDQGKFAEAETMNREALAMRRRLLGNDNPIVGQSLTSLANVLSTEGKMDEAEALLREAVDVHRKLGKHPRLGWSLESLAIFLRLQGKLKEAEVLLREAVALQKELLPADHPWIAGSLQSLAAVLLDEANLGEAEALLQEALAIRRQRPSNENQELIGTLNSLATVLQKEGRLSDAETYARQALDLAQRTSGGEGRNVLLPLYRLASVLFERGKLAEAETSARESVDLYEKIQPSAWLKFSRQSLLGAILLAQKRYSEAEKLLRSAYDGIMQLPDKMPPEARRTLRTTVQRLVQLYEAWDKPDQAAEWRAKLEKLPEAPLR
jgi:tetratricopeptide (TPR) repeat protein